MASGDTLINGGGLLNSLDFNPGSACLETRQFFDSNGLPTVKRRVAVFRNDSPVDPDLIFQFVMPQNYANTTGVTITLFYAPELPLTGSNGNVIWELSLEALQSDTSSHAFNADAWGTPTVASANTPSTTLGRVKSMTIALAKANFGGSNAAGTTAQLCRLRLRRKNSNASDTLEGTILLLGFELKET